MIGAFFIALYLGVYYPFSLTKPVSSFGSGPLFKSDATPILIFMPFLELFLLRKLGGRQKPDTLESGDRMDFHPKLRYVVTPFGGSTAVSRIFLSVS